MNVEKKSLNRARELLKELNDLEEAKDVLKNYDSKVFAVYSSQYNHNCSDSKRVTIKMPPEVAGAMSEYIENRIFQIKKELETL